MLNNSFNSNAQISQWIFQIGHQADDLIQENDLSIFQKFSLIANLYNMYPIDTLTVKITTYQFIIRTGKYLSSI